MISTINDKGVKKLSKLEQKLSPRVAQSLLVD